MKKKYFLFKMISSKKMYLNLIVGSLGIMPSILSQNTFPANGNVGIGTTGPAFPLSINIGTNSAGINIEGTSTNNTGMYIRNKTTTGYSYYAYYANNGGQLGFHYFNAAGNWGLNTSGTEKLTVLGSNGFVGIGTTSPLAKLDVVSNQSSQAVFRNSGGGTDGSSRVELQNTSGHNWKLGVGGTGNGLGLTAGQFYLERTGLGSALTITTAGNVGIGTNNPNSAYKLSVNGSLRAKEVIVETGWADFVFEPEYDLKPLNEVENYINTNKHLPDVPSAAEVKENGVKLGEMESKLLQKIEELTLYTIEANKSIEELKNRNNEANEQIAKLNAKIAALAEKIK